MQSAEPEPAPRVVSVNVGPIREVAWRGTIVRTGIWKEPVGARAVALRGVNLEGDDQADRRVHGGVDKAVYAYSVEDYRYWAEEEGVLTQHGLFGENLTTLGMELRSAVVGERTSASSRRASYAPVMPSRSWTGRSTASPFATWSTRCAIRTEPRRSCARRGSPELWRRLALDADG